MPTTVQMDENGLLVIEMIETFSGGEIPDLLQRVRFFESPRSPHRVTDLTRVRSADLTFVHIWDLARLRMATVFPNRFKSAIVAREPFQIGLARMFITVNEHPQIGLGMFSDRVAAMAWVRAPAGEYRTDPDCRVESSPPVGFPVPHQPHR